MKAISKASIYITQKDFQQYFESITINPKFKIALKKLKEGDIYKIQIGKDVYEILDILANQNHVTLDEAFLDLMKGRSSHIDGRKLMRHSTKLYQKASKIKKEGHFEEAYNQFLEVIDLCSNYSFMRKIKGGAFFHLAEISLDRKDDASFKKYISLCLKNYPEHNLAKKHAINFEIEVEKNDSI